MLLRRRDVFVVLALFLTYIGLMSALALTVDLRFFINDGVSLVVWMLLGLGLAAVGAEAMHSDR